MTVEIMAQLARVEFQVNRDLVVQSAAQDLPEHSALPDNQGLQVPLGRQAHEEPLALRDLLEPQDQLDLMVSEDQPVSREQLDLQVLLVQWDLQALRDRTVLLDSLVHLEI